MSMHVRLSIHMRVRISMLVPLLDFWGAVMLVKHM